MPKHMQPLIESVRKSEGLLGPYDVADHLQKRVDELDLVDALAHFRVHGYAVIEDVAPPEEMDELREAIHSLSTEIPGTGFRSSAHLLGMHPAIDRIATNPKILAFAEVSVGNGMRASQFAGSVMVKSDNEISVHADQNWIPAPFPEHNCVITFCVPCKGMTAEGGATRVVPDSHLKRRHPTLDESHSETIAIEVEKGGVAIAGGRIAQIGRVSESDADRVFEVRDLIIAPGFIDLHTHFDSQIFWDPYCTMSGWHGVTSVVIGNCGFGFAPVQPEHRERAMHTLERNEAIRATTMAAGMPWDWVTFPEYLDSIQRTPKGVNVLSYMGIAPVMTSVWGRMPRGVRRRQTSRRRWAHSSAA